MSNHQFTHLHSHSNYSILTALGSPKDLVQSAKEKGFTALGMADFGNMHGAADFFAACKDAGIKPIIGLDAYLAQRSRHDKEPVDAHSYQLVLFAKTNQGYKNLLKLTTEANLTGFFYKPRIDWELLQKHGQDLLCLSGGLDGEIAQSIIAGDTPQKTKSIVEQYKQFFGDDFYIEIQRHPIAHPQKKMVELRLLELAKELDIKVVATNDVHYSELDDAEAHDILLCIRDNAQKNDPSRKKMLGDNFSLRSAEEMTELFSDLPEAITNTQAVVEKCNVQLEFDKNLLPPFPTPEGHTLDSYLREKCEEGLAWRYNLDPKNPQDDREKAIIERLDYELKVIEEMGFPSYFLIVWDFVKWSKDNGIAVGPGRGSAAGAIVAYVLSITNIDPLRYDLLFERFLNPARISMPDIDIDFADDRRDEVLEYTRQKYGSERVAQICTFGTMAARAAVKDVGRVMGMGFQEMNQFAKLIPDQPGISLDQAHEMAPDLRTALEENPLFQKVWDNAKRLEGGVRHVSVHACAVVISPDHITHHTALQTAPKDANTIITQFSQKPVEKLGLLKMDFLGLKNLTILVAAKQIIEKRHGACIDIDDLPLEDEASFTLLAKGITTGVFQLESAGMRRYLKQLKPTNLDDIIAMVSLYRPGPMPFIPDYIGGKHGTKKVQYAHEDLEKILKNTFGIAVYQEQILQIAQAFAGFSLGEADLLRRAIGKKIASELTAQRQKFIDGAVKKGYQEKLAVHIFDDVIEPFASYGFNKSHAAGYAMIAYQTAYLKANYSTEFMTALLQSDCENTDRVIIDIEDARSLNIDVLPPSINESLENFTVVEDKVIRFGLGAIKGIGESIVHGIVQARGDQPFESLADFAERCGHKIINKKSLEALAKGGALKELELNTNAIIQHFKQIVDFAKYASEAKNDAQVDIFTQVEDVAGGGLELPATEMASKNQMLCWERETLGIFVSDHPLREAKKYFAEKGTLMCDLKKKEDKQVTVGGILIHLRKIITKSKKQMAILNIEDPTGKIEIAVFPNTYEKLAEFLVERDDVVYWVKGKVDYRNGEYQVIADQIQWQSLEEVSQHTDGEEVAQKTQVKPLPLDHDGVWHIEAKDGMNKNDFQTLAHILKENPGETPTVIHMLGTKVNLPFGVSDSPMMLGKVKEFIDI